MTLRQRFYAFEGPDGSGKSSIIKEVSSLLVEKGIDHICVADPGHTNIGKQIRSILLDKNNVDMSPKAELYLYMASRIQLIEEKIKPALKEGKLVLSDRFELSTFVYQSVTNNLSVEDVKKICEVDIKPTYIYLDVDSNEAMKRIGTDLDRMEQRGIDFQRKVRERYLQTISNNFNEIITYIVPYGEYDKVKQDVINLFSKIIREGK